MADGVVGDVVTGEGGEDGGPDGCVEDFVFLCALGFELSVGEIIDQVGSRSVNFTFMIWQMRFGWAMSLMEEF